MVAGVEAAEATGRHTLLNVVPLPLPTATILTCGENISGAETSGTFSDDAQNFSLLPFFWAWGWGEWRNGIRETPGTSFDETCGAGFWSLVSQAGLGPDKIADTAERTVGILEIADAALETGNLICGTEACWRVWLAEVICISGGSKRWV